MAKQSEMTLDEALNIADLAAPAPAQAHQALQTLSRRLFSALTLLEDVRAATGAKCTLSELVSVVARLRTAACAEACHE